MHLLSTELPVTHFDEVIAPEALEFLRKNPLTNTLGYMLAWRVDELLVYPGNMSAGEAWRLNNIGYGDVSDHGKIYADGELLVVRSDAPNKQETREYYLQEQARARLLLMKAANLATCRNIIQTSILQLPSGKRVSPMPALSAPSF